MAQPNPRSIAAFASSAVVVLIAACGSGDGSGSGSGASAADTFTRSLELGVPSTPVQGTLPAADPNGPAVIPLPGQTGPLTVRPGESFNLTIPWSGGPITSVNIGFGGAQYFTVPVPQAGTQTSGQAIVPARLAADVCANLGAICHQITCYEQAGTPFGQTANQQIVLNCTGGRDCSGNLVSPPKQNPCTELGAIYDKNSAPCCAELAVPCDEGVFGKRCNAAFPSLSSQCQDAYIALTTCARKSTSNCQAKTNAVFVGCDRELDAVQACGK